MRSSTAHRNDILRRRSKYIQIDGALAPHNPASHNTTKEAICLKAI